MKVKKSWLNNKNVIVTGAGSGIGKELALILSQKYACNVLAIGRGEENLQALCKQQDKIIYKCADVSTQKGWEEIKEFCTQKNFEVDVIINNAGVIHSFKKLIYLEEKEINKVIDTDYKSIIYSFKTFYEQLKNSKRAGFITISSASAYLPIAGNTIYSSVKSASLAITEAIRQEVMKDNIYVGAVMPGPVITDLYEPDDDETQPKAGRDVSAVGLLASKAGIRIAKNIAKKIPLINIDGTAKLMKFMRKIAPVKTTSLWGKLMRKANRPTFNSVFEDENQD